MSVSEMGQAICSGSEGSHGINKTLIKDPAVLNKAPLYRCYRVTRHRILSESEGAFLPSARSHHARRTGKSRQLEDRVIYLRNHERT